MNKILFLVLLFVISNPAFATRFPPASNVVDPKNYGAIPNDGIPDDSAFLAAERDAVLYGHINEITGDNDPTTQEVYTITQPIRAMILHGPAGQQILKWVNNWIVLCDSDVVIEVPANTPAFSDAANPQGVFQYGSTTLSAPTAPPASGGGSEGYRNTFDGGCTIRIGAGNPGARAGIDWVVNNRGVIRDVKIEAPPGQGTAGIWMGRPWPGPGLIEGVTVKGFQRCVWDGYVQYGITFKNVTCQGQTVYGLDVSGNVASVEGLHSINTVPAIRSTSSAAHLVIIDSLLEGGASNKSALDLGTASKAFIRNVTASGYQSLIRQGTVVRNDLGLQIDEWTSHPTFSYDGTPAKSLRLDAHEAPKPYDTRDWSQWADPRSYGANPNDVLDDRPAIIAAIATGKPILQLVQGHAGGSTASFQSSYYISDTIDIPCTVRRIEGMESKLRVTSSFPAGHPTFRLAAGCDWSDVTSIERLWPSGKGGPMFELNDKRTVYLKDLYAAAGSDGIHALDYSGALFIKNVTAANFRMGKDVFVWAWQFNPEGFQHLVNGMLNDGGVLRALGIKTEGLGFMDQSTLVMKGNSQTEILGGMFMPCVGQGQADVTLGFVIEDGAEFSASYTNWCGKTFDLATWDVQIRETINGEIREVFPEQLPQYTVEGGNRVSMSLYRSHISNTCEQ